MGSKVCNLSCALLHFLSYSSEDDVINLGEPWDLLVLEVMGRYDHECRNFLASTHGIPSLISSFKELYLSCHISDRQRKFLYDILEVLATLSPRYIQVITEHPGLTQSLLGIIRYGPKE